MADSKVYKGMKDDIENTFSDMEEKDGVFYPVKFNAIFSHDQIIKKQIETCTLASELHKKEIKLKPVDNRFMSKRMREIMYLPVEK